MLLKTSLHWGIYLGLATSFGTQILTWLGLGLTNWFVLWTFICVLVFIGLGLREIKRSSDNQISFTQAFLSVVIIIIVARYIFQFYMYLYINYIDPDWVNTVADTWTQIMLDSGMTAAAIDQQISTFRSAWEPINIFTIEVVKYGIAQLILGLIVALFYVYTFRKKKTP